MSQAGRPRPRYIAFRVAAARPVSRKAVQNALTGRARKVGVPEDQLPRLTRYAHPHGIAWSDHRSAAAVRDVLAALTWVIDGADKVPIKVATLRTSGTIKTLTDALGILRERGTLQEQRSGQGKDAPPTRGAGRGPRRPARRP